MDALVTGGTGFVGANLVRELLADGRTVRVLARKGSDRSAEKAVSELGLPQTPAEDALRDAVAWFVERGHAPRPVGLRAA